MNSFGVNFIIRRNPKNQKIAHLYARITVNEEIVESALKGRIDPGCWLSKQEKFQGKTEEVKAWNKYVENIRFRITQHFRRLEDKELIVSAEAVKWAFEGKETKKQSGHTLLELLDYHARINPDSLKPGTMKNYSATRAYVINFIKDVYKREDHFLSGLDFQLITELENYVRNNPLKTHDPCKGNGVGKHMERVCKVVRFGRKLKWIPIYPFEDYSPKITKPNLIKLRPDELKSIADLQLSNPMLILVQDLFLFSCYTGLAYSDVMKFSDADISVSSGGRIWIETYRQKSTEFSPVPLLSLAIKLMEKYQNDPRSVTRSTIFPFVSNQEINRSIKIIAELAGIKKYISFHKARHTFGTVITLKNGVPVETIQQMMGHRKISMRELTRRKSKMIWTKWSGN
jgi:integrase